MSFDSQGNRDGAFSGLFDVGHVALALEPDRSGELLKAELGVLGPVCVDVHGSCSHITNFRSSGKVRTYVADKYFRRPHNTNMARRGGKKPGVPWYLNEWMAALGITKQVDLMERTGWSKATASQLCSGEQTFSPPILKSASEGLGVEPFELLIPPERAMAFRRFYAEAKQVVETGASAASDVADLAAARRAKSAG